MTTIDQARRLCNYAAYRISQEVSSTLHQVDQYLMKESLKPIRVALAAITYVGAALASFTFAWKWIAVAYAVHAVLDMSLEPRAEQRWDDLICRGLNLGLSVRVAYFVFNSIFAFSLSGIAQGMLLGAAIFFKNDWDQHDWSRLRFWSQQRMSPQTMETPA